VYLPINAHLPHDYVTSDWLRLEAYKRLAAADTDEAVAAVAEVLRVRLPRLTLLASPTPVVPRPPRRVLT
jgi:transcription-repair coupling factor (superfamily II helicase)